MVSFFATTPWFPFFKNVFIEPDATATYQIQGQSIKGDTQNGLSMHFSVCVIQVPKSLSFLMVNTLGPNLENRMLSCLMTLAVELRKNQAKWKPKILLESQQETQFVQRSWKNGDFRELS